MKQSNTYIFIYASVMVIAVAAILSFAAMSLKPRQNKNEEIAKKLDILKSVNKALEVTQAKNKNAYVEDEYNKYITNSFVINSQGKIKDSIVAFDINLKKELSKDLKEQNLPIFICELEDQSKKYIITVQGKGLWGPIWGYIALNEDLKTIYGVTFAHKAETPGLGSEIDTKAFQDQFKGKQIYDINNTFTSIEVVKGGAEDSDINGVDAISGGTITSKGLEKMLLDCLSSYENYFNSKNQ